MPHFSGRWGECHAFVGAMKIARNVAVFGRHDEWHHVVHFTIQPGARETGRVRAIFIAPTEGGCHSSCRSKIGAGPFTLPHDYFPFSNRVVRVWGVRGVR